MSTIIEISAEEYADPGSGVADAVRRVAEACDAHDDAITLNEQTCLQLKNRGLAGARLWVAPSGPGVVEGFALLVGPSLDLAVHPDARGRGLGTRLAETAFAGLDSVDIWSHSDHPAAAYLAGRFSLDRERELRIMRRPTSLPLPVLAPPPGVEIRTFRPGDETAFLAVNAAAFAHHPEQGEMSAEDFAERTRETWFDPHGLFLAFSASGDLLGFHWTKVHRDEDPPYGEVYVVAVNPKAAGRGLGTLLTNVGLRHLTAQGVGEVILYVDGDNEPAIAVYESQGFTLVRSEAQYRGRPVLPA